MIKKGMAKPFLFLFLCLISFYSVSAINLNITFGNTFYNLSKSSQDKTISPFNSTLLTYWDDVNNCYSGANIKVNGFISSTNNGYQNFTCSVNKFNFSQSTSVFSWIGVKIDLGKTYYFPNATYFYLKNTPGAGDSAVNFFCLHNSLGQPFICNGVANPSGYWNNPISNVWPTEGIYTKVIYNSTQILQSSDVRFITFGVYQESEIYNNVEYLEIYNLSDVNNNSMPNVKIDNLRSFYCINESNPYWYFLLNISDPENNEILYSYSWNNDDDNSVLVDDFSDTSYNMASEGWSFNKPGCNYSTSDLELNLYNGCNDVQMEKYLDLNDLSPWIDIEFNAWAWFNTSNDYCILNDQDEELVCLRVASGKDPIYNDLYTNFSYWNGSSYIVFDNSSYFGAFSVKFDLNDSFAHICINGIDEPSYNDCNIDIVEELHTTIENTKLKFFMWPIFNFYWPNQDEYVLLDDLKYELKQNFTWLDYDSPLLISHLVEEEGYQYLTILSTDNLHYPDYKKFSYPLNVVGICPDTSLNVTDPFPNFNGHNDYINSIDNGQAKFQFVFYVAMFLVFIIVLIQLRDFSLTLVVIGTAFFCVSFFFTKDLTQMGSSLSLVAFGVTLLIVTNK